MGAGTGWLDRVGVCLGTKATIRHAIEGDLEQLLELYRHLNPSDPSLTVDTSVRQLWSEMLVDNNMHILVIEKDDHLLASCTLVVVQNLTRGARPYGLIENVVTHAEHRRQGYGKQVIGEALRIAWQDECYKVMLLTGNESAVQFYEKCGFVRGVKTGLVAYPAGW